MQVGDLVKPKCQNYFKDMGYAIIIAYEERGDVQVHWVNDDVDVYWLFFLSLPFLYIINVIVIKSSQKCVVTEFPPKIHPKQGY